MTEPPTRIDPPNPLPEISVSVPVQVSLGQLTTTPQVDLPPYHSSAPVRRQIRIHEPADAHSSSASVYLLAENLEGQSQRLPITQRRSLRDSPSLVEIFDWNAPDRRSCNLWNCPFDPPYERFTECQLCLQSVPNKILLGCPTCSQQVCVLCHLRVVSARCFPSLQHCVRSTESVACSFCRAHYCNYNLGLLHLWYNSHRDDIPFDLWYPRQVNSRLLNIVDAPTIEISGSSTTHNTTIRLTETTNPQQNGSTSSDVHSLTTFAGSDEERSTAAQAGTSDSLNLYLTRLHSLENRMTLLETQLNTILSSLGIATISLADSTQTTSSSTQTDHSSTAVEAVEMPLPSLTASHESTWLPVDFVDSLVIHRRNLQTPREPPSSAAESAPFPISQNNNNFEEEPTSSSVQQPLISLQNASVETGATGNTASATGSTAQTDNSPKDNAQGVSTDQITATVSQESEYCAQELR